MSYDYRKAVLEDVENAVIEFAEYNGLTAREILDSREKYEQDMYEEFFIDDSVTGNASGSYTYSSYEAEKNLAGNSELMLEAATHFGIEPQLNASGYEKGAEWWDVTIRCYLLGECLDDVLNSMEV